MNLTNVSTDQLRQALQIKEQIESLQQQLNSLLNGSSSISHRGTKTIGRRTMSAAARARIAAAQRARWAKLKGTSSTAAPHKRRKMSAAGRAAIAAAARARWAKYNAAKR